MKIKSLKIEYWKWARSKDLGVYPIDTGAIQRSIHLLVGDGNRVKAFFNEEFDIVLDKFDEKTDAFFFSCERSDMLYFFIYLPDKNVNPAIIVHEIFHAVYKILDYSGIRLGPDSEEIYSYTSEFLFRKITDALKIL